MIILDRFPGQVRIVNYELLASIRYGGPLGVPHASAAGIMKGARALNQILGLTVFYAGTQIELSLMPNRRLYSDSA
jgi:hypothetical protein